MTLPQSDAGFVTSDLSCFTTGVPFTTAVCDTNNGAAAWRNITWYPCETEQETKHTSLLKKYATAAISKENIDEIAADLYHKTNDSTSVSIQDLKYAAVILEKMINLETLDIPILNSVFASVSNLMDVDSSKLGSFLK